MDSTNISLTWFAKSHKFHQFPKIQTGPIATEIVELDSYALFIQIITFVL